MKTFRFEDGAVKNEVKFNYSTDPDAQALAGLVRAHFRNRAGLHRPRTGRAFRQARREPGDAAASGRCTKGSGSSRRSSFFPCSIAWPRTRAFCTWRGNGPPALPTRSAIIHPQGARRKECNEVRAWPLACAVLCILALSGQTAAGEIVRSRAGQPAPGARRSRQQPGRLHARAGTPSGEIPELTETRRAGTRPGESRRLSSRTTLGSSAGARRSWSASRRHADSGARHGRPAADWRNANLERALKYARTFRAGRENG